MTRFRRILPVCAMAVIVLAMGTWGTTTWLLLPTALDATVTSVDYQSDTGLRFRVLHLDDGRSLVVDRAVVAALGGRKAAAGRHLTKRPAERRIDVDGGAVAVGPTVTWWQTEVALVGLVGVAGVRSARRRRRP